MATQASLQTIQKIYIAFYQRPADAEGLEYWAGRLEAGGGSLSSIIDQFATSLEARTLYGPINSASIGSVVTAIYQGLFGRAPDPEGLAFYTNGFNTGRFTAGSLTLDILNGAKNTDQTIIANKLAVAQQFTALYDAFEFTYNEFSVQRVRDMLAEVEATTNPQNFNGVEYLLAHPGGGVFTLTENTVVTEAVLADIVPVVKTVTYIGFNPHANGETGVDNLDGNNPDGNDNNLTNENVADGGVPLYDLDVNFLPTTNPADVVQKGFFSYIKDITGLDFVQLGLINVANGVDGGGQTTAEQLAGLTGAITIGNQTGDNNTVTVNVTAADGTIHTAEVDINNAYFKLLTNLVFDEESNMRLFEKQIKIYPKVNVTLPDGSTYQQTVYQYVKEAATETIVPIILTPTVNNGGSRTDTGEYDNPTRDNDLIVAGRLELLHQAYIDAGAGESNTLEVDAKGYYAQPAALLNVQNVIVHNLPNVYNTSGGGSTYPDLSGNASYKNSVLDLSRAVDIETLTITESGFDGLQGGANQTTPGSLTVSGVRNGAETTLDGSFTQNVYINYGATQGNGVDLVLNNVNFGSSAQLVVAHNSNTLNIESTGGGNYIANGNLGAINGYPFGNGALTNLVITGNAKLHIDGDLGPSFHDSTPATIDARGNTAGVDLELSQDDEIVFYGTAAADDHFVASSGRSITITGGSGNGEFNANARGDIVITAGGGNNEIYASSSGNDIDGIENEDTVTVTVGNGQNDITVYSDDAYTITAGDGANRIEAFLNNIGEAGVTERDTSVITVGNGQNEIDASSSVLTINAGNGSNDIDATGRTVTVNSGTGNDVIRVADARSITINSTGTDTVIIGGNSPDYAPGNDGALIRLTLGTGATVQLGEGVTGANPVADTITAQDGSFITGTGLTLFVDTVADLRAATLTGVSRIVLDDDNTTFANSPTANDAGSADRALLTITSAQAAQFASEGVAISVQGGIFNTSAHIKVIVTNDLNVTTGSWATWLSSLPASVDLQFEIADGAQLTISAAQLHTKVAQGGISIADDGRTDQVSGKVLITGAGLNFDPFNNSDQARTLIDGREYVGGSLATGSLGFATDGPDAGTTIQRNEWGTNVKIDRTLTGYDRPADTPSYSRLTVDTNAQGGNIGPFQTIETFLRIVGDADLTFTPVKGAVDEWGAPIASGSSIALGVDRGEPANTFMVDFSSATGDITNLTLAHFQNADAMYGNGSTAAPVRVNVEIGGDLAEPDDTINNGRVGESDAGLVSRGIQSYVVTKIDTVGNQAQFWTSRVTENLTTLGLRGNYADTITFGNTDRGVTFLMEVAYDKFDGYAVGRLVADFSRPGADAVVNVVGLQALPAGEEQVVAGISVTDAKTATINIAGGNTVIESLAGTATEGLTLSANADVTIETNLMGTLENINAAAVVGDLTVSMTDPSATDIVFVGAAGGTSLTLETIGADAFASIGGAGAVVLTIADHSGVSLYETTLTNVTAVTMQDASVLTLTAVQVAAIGAADIKVQAAGNTATLNLANLGAEAFSANDLTDGVTLGSVSIAKGAVTLNAATVLTGADVNVGADTTLTLTAEQFMALGDLDGLGANVVINITGLTQAQIDDGFTLSGVSGVTKGTITLAENVNLGLTTSLNGFEVILGANQTLGVATPAQANGLVVEGAAGSVLNMLFSSLGVVPFIDADGFNVDDLRFLDSLVVGTNVDAVFQGLLARVEKIIYNNSVELIDQTVTVSAGTFVRGGLSFSRTEDNLELEDFVLNLQGGTVVQGSVNLGYTAKDGELIQTYLKTVTINSTGTTANAVTGETANIIEGGINASAVGLTVAENELLSLTVNAAQDLDIQGSVVFTAVANADEVATLTVTGAADVSIADLNTQDNDVDGLNVVNNGTGTLSVGINAANIDAADDLSFTGTGSIVLSVTGTVDLSDDVLTAVTDLVLENGANVTLTMAQGDAIGAADITVAAAGNTATLNLKGLAGEPFAVANYGTGITVGLMTLAAVPSITLNAATSLAGINGLVVPEGTVLNLTAAQYKQLGIGNGISGTITGIKADGLTATSNFTVNITGLTQADVANGFDLGGVTAQNLTVTLAGDVAMTTPSPLPADYDGFDLNGADINIGGHKLTLEQVALADGLNITGTAGSILKFTDTAAGIADFIDASGFAVSELHMTAQLIGGENVDLIFEGLAASITKVVTDDYGYVVGTTQTVLIQAGSSISGDVAFIKQEGDVEILDFTMTLQGGVYFDGDVNLSKDSGNTKIPKHLQSVTINSSGTAANVLNGETANVITGDLTSQGGAFGGTVDNNLLDVEINATQALVIRGNVVFESVTGDDAVTANDVDDAVATLSIAGSANVTIGGVDTSDNDVDGLNVINAGTGTVSLTLNAANIDADDALSLTATASGRIALTTTGVIDLSDDTITGVSSIKVIEGGTLTLGYGQYTALGNPNLTVIDGPDAGTAIGDATLVINGYTGGAFDATSLDVNFVPVSIELADQDVTLAAGVNLTNVTQIVVQEGRTLTLTAAQFQQLQDNGAIIGADTDGDLTFEPFNVVITGLTQADVNRDLDNDGFLDADDGFSLAGVNTNGGTITVKLGEANVDLGKYVNGVLVAGSESVLNGAKFDLTTGQTLGLANSTQADGLVVNGTGTTTVVYKFAAMDGGDTSIDATKYNITTLKALATFVGGQNVETLILGLPSAVTERYYADAADLGFVNATSRLVVVEAGVNVPGNLIYNDLRNDTEVRFLDLTMEGGSTITGDLNLSTNVESVSLQTRYFDTLTIRSNGTAANVITGNLGAGALADANPLLAGAQPSIENKFLNVAINATQALTIGSYNPTTGAYISGGTIDFNSIDVDDTVATLTVSGTAPVTIAKLDVTDAEFDVLNVVNSGTGTLTVTGASPSIQADGIETITFSGTGNIVLGTVETSQDFADGIDSNGALTSISAAGLSGNLSIEALTDLNTEEFTFTSGTGVTKVTVTDIDFDSTNGTPSVTDDTAGWNFSFVGAAAGSELHLNDATPAMVAASVLNINMGANGVLYIDQSMNLSGLDLSIISAQAIVLADGATLTLSAAQANGLDIIAGPDTGAAGITAVVNIVDLGDTAVDLSGIAANIAGTATLEDDDVSLAAATNLGSFSITLEDLTGDSNSLGGQTIRFATEAQATREILVVPDIGTVNDSSTNVVWLFNSITAAGGIDTSGYSAALGRLWVSDDLITNEGGLVENLFTTLPSTILRVDFADLTALNILLASNSVNRTMEFSNFTTLGALTFSDTGATPEEHVENLTMKLGGQVTIGNVLLDDLVAGPSSDPDTVKFDTLTIESHRALSSSHILASEGYLNDNDGVNELVDLNPIPTPANLADDTPENVQPNNINTIGNIGVGALDSVNLMNVFIDTKGVSVVGNSSAGSGAALKVGTITFENGNATLAANNADVDALLDITGDNNITIAAINTADAQITGLTIDATGFTAVLDPVMNMDNTEGFVIRNDGGAPEISNNGTAIFQEVEGNTLSVVDASDFDGDLVITLSQVDSTDDLATDLNGDGDTTDAYEGAKDAFTFTAGQGVSTVVVRQVGTNVPTLAANSTWNFDMTGAAAGSSLTIGAGTVLANNGILNVNMTGTTGVTLTIDSTVDLTGVDLTVTGGTMEVLTGAVLTITVDQLIALNAANIDIVGAGTVEVVDGVTDGTDLNANIFTRVRTANLDVSGVTIQTGGLTPDATSALEVNLHANGSFTTGDLDTATITITADNVDDGNETYTVSFTVNGAPAGGMVGFPIAGDVTDANNVAAQVAAGINANLGIFPSLEKVVVNGNKITLWSNALGQDLEVTSSFGGTVGTLASTVSAAAKANQAAGITVLGSTASDVVNGSGQNDTFNLGNGNDAVAGSGGNDTFNVTAGTDTIYDLTSQADDANPLTTEENDVLVVSAGATATTVNDQGTPSVLDDTGYVSGNFIATAGTTNAGTAIIAGESNADQTIDLSLAGGPNGYTITGGNDDDNVLTPNGNHTLIGSAFADVINGGNWIQESAATKDTLTGNAGGDRFVFNTSVSSAATMSLATTTAGVDREEITITADDVNDADETLTVNFTVNGIADQAVVALGVLDSTDLTAVTNAVITALDAKAGIGATVGAAGVVVVSGDNAAAVTITSVVSGGTTGTLAGAIANGTDVAQVTTLTVAGTPTTGDIYSLQLAKVAGGGDAAQAVADATPTTDEIATGLNATFAAAGVSGAVVGSVVTFTDTAADDGGFTITTDTTAAFAGSGASDNGADDYTTADVITDFVSGEDTISFGLAAAVSGVNYAEAAAVADYATALVDADNAFDGNIQYYLTSATDLDGAGAGTDGSGLLFVDANLDGNADLVVLLTGISSVNFAALSIVA